MANHKQILEQMLRDGLITAQQSSMSKTCYKLPQRFDEAIEKAKDRFSEAPDENDTLDFENIEELFGTEEDLHSSNAEIELSNNSSNDTLFFENIEEIVNDENTHFNSPTSSASPDFAKDTVIPPIDLLGASGITPEISTRYTSSESNLIGEGGMGRVIRVSTLIWAKISLRKNFIII